MNIFETISNFIGVRISDAEINANEWILCPHCSVNILKNDVEDNN